jgi:hypothetical protein
MFVNYLFKSNNLSVGSNWMKVGPALLTTYAK